MAHNVVNGFCESGCKVPVKPSAQIEDVQHGGTGADNAPGALKNFGLKATAEELNCMQGITGNVQDQIEGLKATGGKVDVTGAAETIIADKLPANRALVSDANGDVAASLVTDTELSYLDGVTSSIQAQLDKKDNANVVRPVSTGGTGATTGESACRNIGAVKKSGDTMTGDLVLETPTSNPFPALVLKTTFSSYRPGKHIYDIGFSDDGCGGLFYHYPDGDSTRVWLEKDSFIFDKPLSFTTSENGTTASENAKQTLKNLGLDFEIQVGAVDNVGTSGVSVTFPKAFSGVPVVTACGGSEQASVRVHSITKTGFTVLAATSNVDGVQWQAIYIPK